MKPIKLPDIDKSKALLFIGVALLFKVFFFLVCMKFYGVSFQKLYFFNGDQQGYVNFCETFYRTGVHYDGSSTVKDYTYRMPNFIFIYYPIRLFFSQQITLNLIIILQTILSAVSTYVLALTAWFVFKRKKYFYLTFGLYCVSSYVAVYNNMLLTESIGTSLLIISVYLLFTGVKNNLLKWVFASGTLMWLCIFFRAFLGMVWVGALVYILFAPVNFKRRLKLMLAYAVVFLLMESIWVVRNYDKTGQFIAFDSSHFWYDDMPYKAERPYVNFIKAYGFSVIDWIKDYQGTWFTAEEEAKAKGIARPGDDIFPASTFNDGLTIDSLKYARTNLICARMAVDDKPDTAIQHCDAEASRMFNKFIAALKAKQPFNYYIGNRLRVTYRLLNQHTGYQLKYVHQPFKAVLGFIDYFINYLIITGGILGIFILLGFNIRNKEFWLIAFIPVFIIVLFGFLLIEAEARYITTAFPFLLIICVAAIIKMVEKRWFAPLVLYGGAICVLTVLGVLRDMN